MANQAAVKYQSWCPNQVLGVIPNRQSVIDGVVIPVPGKRIQFENGQYETSNKDEISFIENHWLYGSKIVKVSKVADQPTTPPAE